MKGERGGKGIPDEPSSIQHTRKGNKAKRIRGKHRSHVKGKGAENFFRSTWMRRYRQGIGKKTK